MSGIDFLGADLRFFLSGVHGAHMLHRDRDVVCAKPTHISKMEEGSRAPFSPILESINIGSVPLPPSFAGYTHAIHSC
jgi:hypothetical protein